MSDLAARGRPREMSIDAVVIRADGTREDLGTVTYWHRNPLRRLWRRITQPPRR